MTPSSDTRSEIMDAFAAQLAADGYQGISLTGVARTVGIQKPSIYHHFPAGKEELYTAVALRFITRLRERIELALGAPGDLEARLVALAKAADEAHGSISFEQRIYDALDHVSPQARDTVSTRYVQELLDPVARMFTDAARDGTVVGDPWFLMDSFFHLARSMSGSGDYGAARIVALFLNGARPR